jgi:hypothetical protein
MSLTDRVFGAFENELVRHLAFSFTLVRRVDPTGAPSTLMKVWMRNNSSINLLDLRGSISPGPAASFRHTPFYLASLAPGAEYEVAGIHMKILEPTHNRFAYDRMATVNVSGTPDLSRFRFKDTARGMTHVATAIPLSSDPRSDRGGALSTSRRPSSIEVDWERSSRKKPA